jgi:hypothetical protein
VKRFPHEKVEAGSQFLLVDVNEGHRILAPRLMICWIAVKVGAFQKEMKVSIEA